MAAHLAMDCTTRFDDITLVRLRARIARRPGRWRRRMGRPRGPRQPEPTKLEQLPVTRG